MAGKFTVFIFATLFLIGLIMIFYSILISSSSFFSKVENRSTMWTVEKAEEYRGNFKIYNIRYINPMIYNKTNETKEICEANITQAGLVVDLLFRINHMPSVCELNLNGKFIKEYETDLPDEARNEESEELKMSLSLGLVNLDEEYNFEVCCDGYCSDKDTMYKCP